MKKLLVMLLAVVCCINCIACGGNNMNEQKVDNTPIMLTIDNIEDYVLIDVTLENLTETKKDAFLLPDYVYEFDIETVVRPSQGYYFEGVTLEIEWNVGASSFHSGTSTVRLDYTGNGNYSDGQTFTSTGSPWAKSFFQIDSYTIKSVTGQVYKHNPNN